MAGCAGRSVVVSAPTGAGKTAIAEAAAVAVLARGQRVIYTTPLKALSNQKLSEMRARFGSHRVGLQTGDGTLNPGAPPGPGPSPAPLRFFLLPTQASAAGRPSRRRLLCRRRVRGATRPTSVRRFPASPWMVSCRFVMHAIVTKGMKWQFCTGTRGMRYKSS